MWLISILGAALVVVVLRDVFHTLFHPRGQGSISRQVLATTWRLRRRQRLADVAGPLGVVIVIATWATLIVIGGALVYWPHLPEGFSYDTGLAPGRRLAVVDALYLSLVTMTTLGYGDIVPTGSWLRVIAPVQAMIGFSLLTAAVSWVLQIYPALNRRRTLASRLTSLHRVGVRDAIRDADSAMLAVLLEDLAGQVTQAAVDLTQYSETYYFWDRDSRAALPAALPYAADLAEVGLGSARADVRLAATTLDSALDDLARLLAGEFLRTEGTCREVLAAYAEDHRATRVLR